MTVKTDLKPMPEKRELFSAFRADIWKSSNFENVVS